MKKALITGITGQDGSYLAELLLNNGYEVHSIVRLGSPFTTARIDHLLEHKNLFTHHGDLTDSSNISKPLYLTSLPIKMTFKLPLFFISLNFF